MSRQGAQSVPFGGWTPSTMHDHCSGGHPGGHYADEDGAIRCPRCGRLLDLTPCGCGTPGHEHLSRSYCQVRCHDDQRAINRPPQIIERDAAIVARLARLIEDRADIDVDGLFARIGVSPARARALFDGERAVTAGEVGALADILGVTTSWLAFGAEQRKARPAHPSVTVCGGSELSPEQAERSPTGIYA